MTTSQHDGTMIDKMAEFDLLKEIGDSEQKKPWQSGHDARTLFKKHDMRIVIVTMEPAARIKEHHADGTISIQALKGHIRVTVHGKQHDLHVGNLFTLAASIRHDVEAVEESAFLLTISWPSGDELTAMKHRGYGS
ncbi:MAG: cupin domain-containing protein [Edaphobacter sp.]